MCVAAGVGVLSVSYPAAVAIPSSLSTAASPALIRTVPLLSTALLTFSLVS